MEWWGVRLCLSFFGIGLGKAIDLVPRGKEGDESQSPDRGRTPRMIKVIDRAGN